jgi:hypothetical protein
MSEEQQTREGCCVAWRSEQKRKTNTKERKSKGRGGAVAACDSESSSSCLTPSHLFPEAIVAMSRQRKVPEWAVALEKLAALVTRTAL